MKWTKLSVGAVLCAGMGWGTERIPVERVEGGAFGRHPRGACARLRGLAKLDEQLRFDRDRETHPRPRRYAGILRRFRTGYLGNLAFLDVCMGEVHQALEECGLAQDTIVIYTSDHGEMGGEHGLFHKFMFFEPSAGVPLIVSYPRVVEAGKVSSALVEYAGLYPVLAELAGLAPPKGMEAPAFTPWIREPDRPGPRAAYSEYALSRQPRYMIRTDRYKYVFNETDVPELYDLEPDPAEFVNLANDAAVRNIQRQIHEQLVAWYDPARNPFRGKRNRG